MIYQQPVCYEYHQLAPPVLLIVGAEDHTVSLGQYATPAEAARLGDFCALSAEAARGTPPRDPGGGTGLRAYSASGAPRPVHRRTAAVARLITQISGIRGGKPCSLKRCQRDVQVHFDLIDHDRGAGPHHRDRGHRLARRHDSGAGHPVRDLRVHGRRLADHAGVQQPGCLPGPGYLLLAASASAPGLFALAWPAPTAYVLVIVVASGPWSAARPSSSPVSRPGRARAPARCSCCPGWCRSCSARRRSPGRRRRGHPGPAVRPVRADLRVLADHGRPSSCARSARTRSRFPKLRHSA